MRRQVRQEDVLQYFMPARPYRVFCFFSYMCSSHDKIFFRFQAAFLAEYRKVRTILTQARTASTSTYDRTDAIHKTSYCCMILLNDGQEHDDFTVLS